MAGEWASKKIGDLGKVVTGKTPSTKVPENFYGDYPFVTIPDMDGRRNIDQTTRTLSELGAESLRSCRLPQGAVMMSCIATIGRCGITTRPSFTNQQINSVICHEGIIPDYLYYCFTQLGHALETAGGGGSVYTNVSKSRFAEIEVPTPPLPEQKAIAHVLGSLDDKIELNRRMNETLEGMAQALFKSWFVDFDPVIDNALAAGNPIPEPLAQRAETRRQAIANGTANRESAQAFPASFRCTEELGWIPEGWEVEVFNHLATLDTSSIKPFEEPETSWEHYSIPAFDSSKMPVWEDGKEIKSNKYKVKEGAILASKLNPETERTWWPFMMEPEKAICSTEFMQFVPHEKEEQTFIYSLIRSDPFQANILERVTGSTGSRQRAKPKEIAEINVIDCGSELREKYVKAARPCLTLIQNNSLKCQTLAKLRDVLLPKLISGELRIPQAEKMVEETIA